MPATSSRHRYQPTEIHGHRDLYFPADLWIYRAEHRHAAVTGHSVDLSDLFLDIYSIMSTLFRYLRDSLDLRFPRPDSTRELYYVTVSRRRSLWALVLGFCLALIL